MSYHVLYFGVSGVHFAFLYDLSVECWNYFDSGVYFVFHFTITSIRDRPFNLQGEGVIVFCFVQEKKFGQHES